MSDYILPTIKYYINVVDNFSAFLFLLLCTYYMAVSVSVSVHTNTHMNVIHNNLFAFLFLLLCTYMAVSVSVSVHTQTYTSMWSIIVSLSSCLCCCVLTWR